MRHLDDLAGIRHAEETGQTRLDLTSMGLTEVPPEIVRLNHLETLDLSGNLLTEVPEFLAQLGSLRRLFLSKNRFSSWPRAVARLSGLQMLSLKSNQLTGLPESGWVPDTLCWLILTDNRLESLPGAFGASLPRLRKLALAGNRLRSLPRSFGALSRLELLRLGMNQLAARPPELEHLSMLTWLGLGGNPFGAGQPVRLLAQERLARCRLDPGRFRLGERLGSGASGVVYRADWLDRPERPWAVKQFSGVSADGRPEDELAVAAVAATSPEEGDGSGIIPFRGWWSEGGPALVMEFFEDAEPLGLVPSFDSVTRDCYPPESRWEPDQVRRMLRVLAGAQKTLIGRRVIHGDFYAHNILINPAGEVKLGDWGASFFFGPGDGWMEKMEVRAFGCLMEELLERCGSPVPSLASLRDRCLAPVPADRPGFAEVAEALGR